jgi:hypothetical protein
MLSQVFTHRTNASRAARRMGLKKAPLIAVAGGYQFQIPDGVPLPGIIQATADKLAVPDIEPPTAETIAAPEAAPAAPPAPIADEPEPTDEELLAARAAHTIVNGAPLPAGPWRDDQPTAPVADAKPPRQRRRKAASKPKTAKAAKAATKAAKRPEGVAKRGTPEYAAKMAARRTSQGRSGITEQAIAEIKARWTSADDLMKMTGWVSNTLRGVLSLYAKKHGVEIEGKTIDGVRHYRIARG